MYLADCNAAMVGDIMKHCAMLEQQASSLSAWFVVAMPGLFAESIHFADTQELDEAEGLPANCAVLHDLPSTTNLTYHMLAGVSGSKAKVLFDLELP